MEADYHFSIQFTADLIAMNTAGENGFAVGFSKILQNRKP